MWGKWEDEIEMELETIVRKGKERKKPGVVEVGGGRQKKGYGTGHLEGIFFDEGLSLKRRKQTLFLG